MTATPKIPRGWRRLRSYTNVHNGDKFWDVILSQWVLLRGSNNDPVSPRETVIRRVRKNK